MPAIIARKSLNRKIATASTGSSKIYWHLKIFQLFWKENIIIPAPILIIIVYGLHKIHFI